MRELTSARAFFPVLAGALDLHNQNINFFAELAPRNFAACICILVSVRPSDEIWR